MATTTPPPPANNSNSKCDISKSRFLPTECLVDWWLAKAEDETEGTILAVSGHTIAGKQSRRFCSSLPILKRHDEFNLETTDGKTVILKGFLNKDRSLENGFPSHVCNHFKFGFPDYWKTCTKPYMVKEPSPDKARTRSLGRSENEQKSNIASAVHSGGEKTRLKSVSFSLDFDNVELEHGESNQEVNNDLHVEDSTRLNQSNNDKMSELADGCSVEQIPETSNLKYNLRRVQTRGLVKQTSGDTKIKARTRSMSKCDRGMISPEQISSGIQNEAVSRSRSRLELKETNGQASVVLDNQLKDRLDRGISSPKKFLSDSKNKARTRSLGRSENEQKSNIASAVHSGGEKTRLKSVSLSLDFDNVELEHGESNREVNNDLHVEDSTRLNQSNNDKMSELADGCSVEQIPVTSNLKDNLRRVQTRGLVKQMSENKITSSLSKPVSDRKISAKSAEKDMKMVQTRGLAKQKSKSKLAPSLSQPASGRKGSPKAKSAKASHLSETLHLGKDVGKVQTKGSKATPSHTKPISDDSRLSENAKAPSFRRKLTYKTPEREKKSVPAESPQLTALKRSRSGRLLSPRLEFWRNQRRFCDADGTVTGIKFDMQPEQRIAGSETRARRKRRQLQ